MITSITGSNHYLLSRRLEQLVADFDKQYGDLAIERIDGSEAEASAITAAVSSQPFLSERKLVVVRNLASNKAAAEQIEQIIDSVSENSDLILYEPITDKRSAYYKTLKSKTSFEECTDLEPRELSKWLAAKAEKLNAKLSNADASYLIERVGLNQAILASELEKLVLYDNQISRQNIDLLTERTPQSKIFDLLDAAFAGNTAKALDLYEEQRAQKVEPQAILALLIWQLNLIAVCKAAGQRSAEDIASQAKLNPYPLAKAMNLARKITDKKFKQLVSDLAEIDYKNKSVYLDLDEALKSYLTTL